MSTNFPNGVSSFGVPVLGGSILTTGNIFFVDSGASNAADSPANGSKRMPFATIDYAVGRCTANNGDHIIAMPGHAEVVASAGALAVDVAGVTIVGIGRGAAMPTVTATSATGDVDIDAANVTIEGLNFVAGVADNAVTIDVNAVDFTIRNCRFTEPTVDENMLICIQDGATTTSDRMTIENNVALLLDAANTHFVNLAGTGNGHIIRGNVLMGDWGTMAIGGAGIVTMCTIAHNMIHNSATDADACINMGATATGILAYNVCSGGHATAGIVCGDLGALENYYELSTSDLSGVIEPAIA
jgi:hypothetical protein